MTIFPISPSFYSPLVKINRVIVPFGMENRLWHRHCKMYCERKLSKTIKMENLLNRQVEAFRAVFLFGKFDNVQARRVFVPIALFMASAILVFGHLPKF